MSSRWVRWGWVGGLCLAVISCGAEAPVEIPEEDAPEEEVAPMVERIEASVLQALPSTVTAERLEQGRRQYVVCSVCHGFDGRGTNLGPTLRGPEWIHIAGQPDEIAEIVRAGVAQPAEFPVPMPVMGGGDFDEEDLEALSWYVHALARSGP